MAGLGLVIVLTAPGYAVEVQRAPDADAFRRAVAEDGRARVVAAALVDVAFVGAYVLFATTFRRRNVVTAVGSAIVVVGAVGDFVENGLVLSGLARLQRLTDGDVLAIRLSGSVKWAGTIIGAILILAGHASNRRSSDAQGS